jgi:putative hydrolase of the HAD superfamily
MKVPENIIFDLGGVLLNIDYAKTEEAFIRLGFTRFTEMYNQFSANAVFANLETGKISTDSFYENMLQASEQTVSKEQVTSAWNAMLLDFREPSLQFLEKLAENHRLFLLSNTNAVHYEAFMKIFAANFPDKDFDSYFSKAYYSHEIGLRKPGKEVFEFVMEDAGVDPGKTLFIDDSYNNIEGAKKAGLHTHLLLAGESIEELLIAD